MQSQLPYSLHGQTLGELGSRVGLLLLRSKKFASLFLSYQRHHKNVMALMRGGSNTQTCILCCAYKVYKRFKFIKHLVV